MDECCPQRHGMRRPVGAHVVLTLLLALVVLCAGSASALIPYTPSQLLYSLDHNGSFAYLLHSTGSSQNATTELLSLNVSGVVNTADPRYSTLTSPLPFHDHGNASAYIPVLDTSGVLKVVAGDCRATLDQGALWQFTPKTNDSIGNGTWEQLTVDISSIQSSAVDDGPNFLSAGFAYASTNTSDSSVYTFGGMCPFTKTKNQAWMAAANYSQTMLVLDPHISGDSVFYDASTTGNRAPPIAEAGFTITPLQATSAYLSNGESRKQQDFLFIGGQTRDAFINMSQLAVFSLPQHSWSFVNVMTAPTTFKTELAVREFNFVEPRSGHTAVLSPDGSKVIVYGGWVGNTSVAAQPQLAILEIGADYEEWTWKIPSTKGPGNTAAAGIYGHGATMLPGGVMMIAGGHSIPQPSSKRSLTGSTDTSQIYLYNVTAGEWASSYENPYSRVASTSASGSSDSRKKTGLGVGLGLGIPVVIGLAVFLFFYSRRRYKRRSRDQELRNLALGAERAHFWGGEEPFMASSMRRPCSGEMEENTDWKSKRGSGQSSIWHDKGGGETLAESAGLLGESSSPTKTNPSGLNARMYRPPTQYSEFRRGDATCEIHPIDEREEDEAKNAGTIITQETYDHPRRPAFLPPLGANIGYSAVPLVPLEIIAGVGLEQEGGTASSEKDERTSSNLSDSSTTSARSIFQARALHLPYISTSSQPVSGRQLILKPTGAESTHSSSGASSDNSSRDGPRSRPNSMALSFVEHSYTSDSYSTAQTSISQRQSEGEHLLPHQPPQGLEESVSPLTQALELFPMPGSKPTAFPAAIKPRTSEWIGSNVRRVLSLTRRRPPTANYIEPANAFTSIASGIDINLDRRSTVVGNGSSRPSHASSFASGYRNTRTPRRSVSASAELFRRKQGARDWGAGNKGSVTQPPWRDDSGIGDELVGLYSNGRRLVVGDGEEDDGDEDWDVEGAAEGRRVQVTFTVPKEKLRVVNATAGELDGLSERSVSGGFPRRASGI